MRTDEEMMKLILDTARLDQRILAAYLKGSRTNPHAPPDRYRDFDVMYVVRETASMVEHPQWLEVFGRVILKQEQDDPFGYGERFGLRGNYDQSYSWLLLFEDGTRIDVGIETLQTFEKGTNRNKLFLPLLDKTGCLPCLPPPTDEDFYIQPPTASRYRGCCNEFFWCLCDVAKGIARDELPFAMTTYNTLVRNMLEKMLEWYVGTDLGCSLSCGKLNKYFKRYLPPELYDEYVHTYTDGSYEHFWAAIDAACRLFRKTAMLTAAHFGFTYPREDEEGFRRYAAILRNRTGEENNSLPR